MNKRSQLTLIIIGFFLMLSPAWGDDLKDVETITQKKIDSILAILKQPAVQKEQKAQQIVDIVSPIFDFRRMAMLSLGRRYWPEMTDGQKKRFLALFTERLKSSFVDKIALYSDETFNFEPATRQGQKIQVPAYLVSQGNQIGVLFKFYHDKKKEVWQIYDIEVQGVSLIQSFRTQFHEILKNGSIDTLLAKLAEPVTATQ